MMNTTNISKTKIRVVTVVGTRPEIIRLSRVIAVLDEYTEHFLVHTGKIMITNSMKYSLMSLKSENLIFS